VVVGRRTFGKGLVQNGYYLTDGSMIRLTVARYFTPTGRSIQSSYKDGYDQYMRNFINRYSNGEIFSADSIHLSDTLRFKTLVYNRTVYGGGGIMPDIFVAQDTSFVSEYYRALLRKDIFRSFTLEYSDINRDKIKAQYRTFDDFSDRFSFSPVEIQSFISKADEAGVTFNESQYRHSEEQIILLLKALVAGNLWHVNEYYRIVNTSDEVIARALQIIKDEKAYRKILGSSE
jgi:carboxyl-terminal processing protease